MLSSLEVAEYFIFRDHQKEKPSITHKKLQKLVYYAQAWSMVFRGEPIFSQELQAWIHGAVEPHVWSNYKQHGASIIPLPNKTEIDYELTEQKVLAEVYRFYGNLTADELEELCHREEPWQNARIGFEDNQPSQEIIELEDIRCYYSNFSKDKIQFEIDDSAADINKERQVEFELINDSKYSINILDVDSVLDFIAENLGKFKQKSFKPRRKRTPFLNTHKFRH
jgi:uncharacterized phage-associated protein